MAIGDVLGLMGLGKNGSQDTSISELSARPYMSYGSGVSAIGDSITSCNGIDSGSQLTIKANYMDLAACWSGKGFKHIKNAGASGETTTQMLSRIDADIIAIAPSICFIMGGINDLGAEISAATTVSNIEQMVLKCIIANILPVVISITPWVSYIEPINIRNIMLQQMCTSHKIPFINAYQSLVNPATGALAAEYDGGDGVHPNYLGHRVIANSILTQLFNFFPSFNSPVIYTNTYNDSLLANGLFIDDGNSDGIPDGWDQTEVGNTTVSLVSGADVLGKWMKLTSAGAAAGQVSKYALTGFSVGDKINVSGKIKTSGIESGGANYSIFIYTTGAGQYFNIIDAWPFDTTLGQFSFDFVIPTGTVYPGLNIRITGGTGELYVGQLSMRNLTTLGLV